MERGPEERIRRRAYEIYRARNDAPGDEFSDWRRAENELTFGHRGSAGIIEACAASEAAQCQELSFVRAPWGG
ncbi:MAG: DUF2934 domain-containing protein [Phycisphaerales bacterium]